MLLCSASAVVTCDGVVVAFADMSSQRNAAVEEAKQVCTCADNTVYAFVLLLPLLMAVVVAGLRCRCDISRVIVWQARAAVDELRLELREQCVRKRNSRRPPPSPLACESFFSMYFRYKLHAQRRFEDSERRQQQEKQ